MIESVFDLRDSDTNGSNYTGMHFDDDAGKEITLSYIEGSAGYANTVNGIPANGIGSINGVATANISRVNGV